MKPHFTYAIKALVPDAHFSTSGNEIINWDSKEPQPSDEAIQAKLTELQNAYPMQLLREKRNRKLAETDWRASSDLTLSSEWSTYRQALRDLPSTATPTLDDNGNLQNVTWPEEPT
jgi:hypothetical protein